MAYTITGARLAMGNTMVRVTHTRDGGPEMVTYFTVAELREKTDVGSFEEAFPRWLKARAHAESVDLKTVTFAQLRTYLTGKVIPSAPTMADAKLADGV